VPPTAWTRWTAPCAGPAGAWLSAAARQLALEGVCNDRRGQGACGQGESSPPTRPFPPAFSGLTASLCSRCPTWLPAPTSCASTLGAGRSRPPRSCCVSWPPSPRATAAPTSRWASLDVCGCVRGRSAGAGAHLSMPAPAGATAGLLLPAAPPHAPHAPAHPAAPPSPFTGAVHRGVAGLAAPPLPADLRGRAAPGCGPGQGDGAARRLPGGPAGHHASLPPLSSRSRQVPAALQLRPFALHCFWGGGLLCVLLAPKRWQQ
jgi:hypothetical protein